ncbi:putative TRAP-type mannitol/chloroaromatic compound transport system, periplasmic component [Vibrio nigripulchritudo SFn27]|uniref:Putative TRAP-type mannitol/chloroaromatic compound transport system, periplasmic component n=2 Tax=Vibrio nigripulchritudo TaxID=28173 RepID=U4KGS0_9VIBR|nr:putative TRAP-type mannitol/chloroaromatic compound transport system, periplasmic component [Vibrio nigripulchritudo BLFn1]CCN87750.1 putative TRAP-type mannitol/chloroaromatic compound transport system, periplasmic component [Vibrio nigripulchritudo SFn27]CCN95755.1 putative TRAP-type mannitol/chloroaromatic compound transport system, periplasmic component [Vibrio nigripulchritudo ENn2]CCO38912.1 putative TRAP-type mannitol/chloroaromatic compound transport system, periplasmic component [Vib
MTIKRCFSIAMLALTAIAVSPGVSASEKVYRLKLAETWGPNTPILGDATKNMAKLAKEMSNGRLEIRIDSANKHKAPLGIFDMVKSGQYDLGHSSSYYWKGKVPNTLYFSSMPFGMMSTEQYAWFYRGGGMELMQRVYAPHNMLSFPGGNSDIQMGGWFKKEISSVEDLKGLKIRIPGFAGEVMAKIGAKPTNIAPGELYTSLERGTIDALEWVGPAFDLRMGFQKIAPYYYSAWHEPGSETQFLVNKRVWEKLPKDLQVILETAFRVTAFDMYNQALDANANSWATMKSEFPDIKVRDFPPSVLAAMRQATDELLQEQASNDELAKEIIQSQADYLKKIRGWTDISLKAYLNYE